MDTHFSSFFLSGDGSFDGAASHREKATTQCHNETYPSNHSSNSPSYDPSQPFQ